MKCTHLGKTNSQFHLNFRTKTIQTTSAITNYHRKATIQNSSSNPIFTLSTGSRVFKQCATYWTKWSLQLSPVKIIFIQLIWTFFPQLSFGYINGQKAMKLPKVQSVNFKCLLSSYPTHGSTCSIYNYRRQGKAGNIHTSETGPRRFCIFWFVEISSFMNNKAQKPW